MFPMMQQYGIDKLNNEEKHKLVEEIWESMEDLDEEMPPLTDAQKAELDCRLADYYANPKAGYTWEEVKEHLRERRQSRMSSSS